ncbi:hypothetical protein K474DRAFT_784223 [Panus rudis PR-1116 ss-1]|nr:hypothetical protein K474DRAFT_784223 [Panus rudis PR-1116 ss-1]
MPLLLSSILANSSRTQQPFILLQSSAAQSCLPVLQAIISQSPQHHSKPLTKRHVLLFCFLYPPARIAASLKVDTANIELHTYDWTGKVPGYDDEEPFDINEEVLKAIQAVPSTEPFDVVLDSADTLLSSLESASKTYTLLSKSLSLVRCGPATSRLIVHIVSPSPLIPQLTQTRFSSSLTHLTSHPPALLLHVSSAYLTLPPPLSPPEKFWSVFGPISERWYESEKLVFGGDGEGWGGEDVVVEVLIRGPGAGDGGRKRGVERVLEGWKSDVGRPSELSDLESLKSLWSKKAIVPEEPAADPTQNVSFNLNLTPEQQQARAQVPLPYAHEGKQVPTEAAILYDPDSADDIDDDDPDEDLDI